MPIIINATIAIVSGGAAWLVARRQYKKNDATQGSKSDKKA